MESITEMFQATVYVLSLGIRHFQATIAVQILLVSLATVVLTLYPTSMMK